MAKHLFKKKSGVINGGGDNFCSTNMEFCGSFTPAMAGTDC